RAEPDHPLRHTELAGEAEIRSRVAAAEDEQARTRVGELRERADRRREALARKAAAGEQDGEGPRRNGGLDARRLAIPATQPRMEALEVHAVVDDRESRRGHRQRMLGDAGLRRLPPRARTVHVVAVRDEGAEQPGRRALHATVKRVRPGDDENSHGALRGGAPARRSMSGNRTARAAAKL